MALYTENLGLYLENDPSAKFKDWRDKMNGQTGSNMEKIDAAVAGKQDKLTGTQGQVVGFDASGNAVAQAAPDPGVVSFKGRKGAVVPANGDYTADQVGAVPTSRKINGKTLNTDLTLSAADVGASPASHSHSNYVPTTRKVNNKALSADIALTAADVGALTQSSADGRYLKLTGGTVTGPLSVQTPTANTHTANKQYVDDRLPSGIIVMWSGTVSNIPTGWTLCNGQNGTPDLRNRFVLGAGSTYAVGAKGGESAHTLTVNEMPSHTHLQDYNTMYADYNRKYHVYGFVDYRHDAAQSEGSDGNYYSGTTLEAGGGQSHNNMPPYYALCYIMKL